MLLYERAEEQRKAKEHELRNLVETRFGALQSTLFSKSVQKEDNKFDPGSVQKADPPVTTTPLPAKTSLHTSKPPEVLKTAPVQIDNSGQTRTSKAQQRLFSPDPETKETLRQAQEFKVGDQVRLQYHDGSSTVGKINRINSKLGNPFSVVLKGSAKPVYVFLTAHSADSAAI